MSGSDPMEDSLIEEPDYVPTYGEWLEYQRELREVQDIASRFACIENEVPPEQSIDVPF
jgi:hypothetical protein